MEGVRVCDLFGWLVADGWCWFVPREECCWLIAGGWFVLREKYCWLLAVGFWLISQANRALITMSATLTWNWFLVLEKYPR
jgi:hypothetical protein